MQQKCAQGGNANHIMTSKLRFKKSRTSSEVKKKNQIKQNNMVSIKLFGCCHIHFL